jgi:hypothetical protein
MKRSFLSVLLATLSGLLLVGCLRGGARPDTTPPESGGQRAWFDGEYGNHEQVTQAGTAAVPRVRIAIAPLRKTGWYSWSVRMSAASDYSATWALRSDKSANGSMVLTPFRPLVAEPGLAADFDLEQWVALDACALRGNANARGFEVKADPAACAILIPGIGASAALLPLEIGQEGESLHVRLYADQARGPEARIDARRLRWFSGWAAINGAGQAARVENDDWHMNRDIRIDNEGGRVPLNWRDGEASGYSLVLERMTYRDGNVPVLKLSILEDASGRSVAYAWANPEANRIGINLGWVQVGLEASAMRTQ